MKVIETRIQLIFWMAKGIAKLTSGLLICDFLLYISLAGPNDCKRRK
jgi:hypothetical protein